MESSESAIVVGIDEAGYGPVLGPLVVSAVAFEMPTEDADRSLWDVLAASVTGSARPRDRRIAICDSKKLHRPDDGIGPLERSALAMLGAWRGMPTDLHELLKFVAPHVMADLAQYPWYREANPGLPLAADAGGARLACAALSRDAAAQGVRLAGFWSEPLLEGHYNRLVDRTRNKSVVLLGLTLRLIQLVADAHPGRDIRFLIDKQGGRGHYGAALMRAFDDAALHIVEEGADVSCYRLTRPRGAWRIDFGAKGDSLHLPVALASIVSKYLREVFMACFNGYWRTHAPAAAPTAGYYTDGHRFLREIDAEIARLGVDRRLLVRQR